MHKINITSGLSPSSTKILLNEQPFEGIQKLDIRMRVDEVVSITAKILPELVELEYQDPDVFIVIGDKKYRLMECVGDGCKHHFINISNLDNPFFTFRCGKCGFEYNTCSEDGEA